MQSAGRIRGKLSTKGLRCISWITYFGKMNGDKMPDQECINLPPCMTKTHLHEMFQAEETKLSKSSFFRLWKQYLPWIKIPKVINYSCTLATVLAYIDRQKFK